MDGWILLHRKLCDNKLWTCEPFTRGQAWVDMLMLTSHSKQFFYIRGNKVNIEPGQLAWGEVKLAERWRWSRTKLRKFLNDLEKEQQIIQQKSTVIQIITIKNYEIYQKKDSRLDNRKTTEEQQKNIYKECITKIKNDEEIKRWDSVFSLWLKHKAERKESYKKTGMERMINKLFEYSENNPELAMKIIDDAISKNYAGFFKIKDKRNGNTTHDEIDRIFNEEIK